MSDPQSSPRDIREEPFLETLGSIGVDVSESPDPDTKEREDGTGYLLVRGEIQAFISIAGGRVYAEQVVQACHDLRIEFAAFSEHYYNMKVRGEI